jgi:hypothetical protein
MTSSLLPILPAVDDVLFNFAQSDGFWANLETAFGTSYDVVKATELRQQWQSRNFSQLPPIEVLSDEVLGTANGAYSSSKNKIYLSASFLNTASSAAIVNVILEEIGHYVDAQINPVDSAGDEGAIFAELVQGNSLDVATLEALRGENDQTIIIVNGEIIQVEQTNLTGTSNNDNITGTSLTLTSETGYAVGTTTPVTGTINNDDTNVTLAVSFSRANFQIGEDGKAFVPVTINLTGGSGNSGNGSVTLSLADGTATTFQDYNLQTFTINFNPGETTKTLQISIINDAVAESSETINLTLSNPTGNIILGTQKTATLTIIDNDTVWAGFADVVLDYFDSGTGPIPGPYGFIGSAGTTPINLDAALGNDPNSSLVNTVTLPTGSYITLGFIDETIINGPGNDIFVREDGAAGDRANVFVSSNLIDFTFLGVAQDNITTAFDLSSINYTETVRAVKIVGLNREHLTFVISRNA